MGKKRQTAKTGDKKLYKSRFAEINEAAKPKDDDNMYNEIDRYHNEKDKEFLRLDQQPDEELDDDGYADKEAVMDLAGGASSSGEEDDENDDSDDEENQKPKTSADTDDSDDDEGEQAMSSDDDDEEEMDEEAVTDWGRRKSSYFGGDTADLEIGQNAEDAYLEEEAAKEVQAARYDQMDEDDFVLSDQEDEDDDAPEKASGTKELESVSRDLKKLSRAAKRKLLQSHHPELLPLVGHFSEVVKDWNDRTRVASSALFSSAAVTPQDVGATSKGLEYLLTKSLLQTSTALNVAAYLLLKAEHAAKEKDVDDFVMDGDAGSEIKSHPVMTRLQQLNKLSMKLEDTVESKVPSLQDQLDNLVKAASLMQEEGSGDEEEEETEESEVDEENGEMMEQDTPLQEEALSEDEKIDEDEEQEIARGVLNDARFGLRPQEVKAATSKTSSSKRKPRRPVPSDFGDEEKEDARSRKAAQSLASTVNAMQQRSASKSRKPSRHDEILDAQDQEAAMARGLKMMEAEMGALDDDGIEAFGGGVATAEVDDELDDGLGGGDSFYDQVKKKSEARKAFKKQLHAVAPKFPRSEVEVDGERAINSVILKNRGLVAHKNKLNRNPRVKKREQYRKALIKRKGNVREIRTEEGHKYAGEETGIKTGLSRSRKLGTN